MKPKPERPDWKATNPNYKTQPTQRHADGSISQDGGTRSDQLHTLREWYALNNIKSYSRGE
ncbi:hypothetical protein ACQR5W_11700 [Xanthomonas sacchari]